MTRRGCSKLMRGGFVVMAMAVLAAATPHAQAPPRPTFDITRYPALHFNVWPSDINKDGTTDLVAGTRALNPLEDGDVVVASGRGNGTFDPAVVVYRRGVPLVASDVNGDGFPDIVITSGTSLQILAGNGDGTFDAPVDIGTMGPERELRTWAFVGDMNGDGRRDLIVPDWVGGPILKFYPGAGGLAFGPPIVLPTADGMSASEIATGDFNGDGRRDFALVNLCCNLSIYLNQGSNAFARTDLPGSLNDIVAADVNGDGKLDLVGVSGRFDVFTSDQPIGQVQVRLGNGNGTFGAATIYSSGVPGSTSVVVGDFNADGRLDIAAGNRSALQTSDNGVFLSDSVSVLPGTGAGSFLPAVVYALSYVPPGDFGPILDNSQPYWGAIHQLNTSDLNGDGRTDLITSPGAILLNRAPRTNRQPLVFAGPDRAEQLNGAYIDLYGDASDPDMDWLSYTWTDESGTVLGRSLFLRVQPLQSSTRTYTLTVDDGHGGVAADSVTVRLANNDVDPFVEVGQPQPGDRIQAGVPYTVRWSEGRTGPLTGFTVAYSLDDGRTFTTIPGCANVALNVEQCTWANPGPASARARVRVTGNGDGGWISVSGRFSIVTGPILPNGWTAADVGVVGAPGTTSFANGVWTIEGSGADIWDTADELRYVYMGAGPRFSLTARVSSIENLNRWVKAGIMIREDLSPGARQVSLLATPTTERGIAFQRRPTPDGYSVHTSGPAVAPPGWLRLGRNGDTVTAYYGTSPTGPWLLVGREVLPGLRTSVYVGLAVSSHVDGQLATATFDNVAFDASTPLTRHEDVGSVGLTGSTTYDGVVYELRGSGADVWGTADAFHYAYSYGYYSIGSINSISVRVRGVDNTHPSAKAGVMYRELSGSSATPAADARHVMVAVLPGRGIAMQYRATTGGPSVQVAVRPGVAPAFVSLTRSGYTFTGATSSDGITWTTLGEVTLPGLFAEPGLFVTSHDNATRATATFDTLRLTLF